jgi:hypothetical protein
VGHVARECPTTVKPKAKGAGAVSGGDASGGLFLGVTVGGVDTVCRFDSGLDVDAIAPSSVADVLRAKGVELVHTGKTYALNSPLAAPGEVEVKCDVFMVPFTVGLREGGTKTVDIELAVLPSGVPGWGIMLLGAAVPRRLGIDLGSPYDESALERGRVAKANWSV